MNEFITEDVNVLIQHLNYIAIKRNLKITFSVSFDLINHKEKQMIELQFNYLMHDAKSSKAVVTSTITLPYDQYLDEKDEIIKAGNFHLYNEILLHTSFEPELNNINDKYKWN
jgi:hypothetical protein